MSRQSPFAIFKALQAIGEPKSVKKMRSGDLLVETKSAIQFRYDTTTDLLTTPDAEILDGFSDQGVIQVRRITIKKDATVIPTKHMILTFNNPNLPATVKAGYLNCKIRPYVPNPLRCFKCQRFGHSQTACRGQLTCSRCATVGHPSTDCTLEPKCVNCFQSHPSTKTHSSTIIPILRSGYQTLTTTTTTQTDENITKIVCPPLKLLQPLVSVPKPTISSSVTAVTKPSSSTQAQLLPSASFVTVPSLSESQSSIPLIDTAPTTSNSLSISAASSSSTACSVLETTPSGGSPSLVRSSFVTVPSLSESQSSIPLIDTAPTTSNSLSISAGLVRWGLGGSGHVEGTGEKLSFASQAAR
ncbi:uncharacterized protein TNCV_3162121 [Trichonephila clavipes]|nr:uncharacterized protein TNCV_3162121 [Trichonephila clavipes]